MNGIKDGFRVDCKEVKFLVFDGEERLEKVNNQPCVKLFHLDGSFECDSQGRLFGG